MIERLEMQSTAPLFIHNLFFEAISIVTSEVLFPHLIQLHLVKLKTHHSVVLVRLSEISYRYCKHYIFFMRLSGGSDSLWEIDFR